MSCSGSLIESYQMCNIFNKSMMSSFTLSNALFVDASNSPFSIEGFSSSSNAPSSFPSGQLPDHPASVF